MQCGFRLAWNCFTAFKVAKKQYKRRVDGDLALTFSDSKNVFRKDKEVKEKIYQYYEEKEHFKKEVPEKIKQIASLIMFRFNIEGLCDGMYICNVMANCSGSGDGCGHFSSDYINTPLAAAALRGAYGCNIYTSDMDELCQIIDTNDLCEETEKNIELSMLKCKMKMESERDEWRVSYYEKELRKYKIKLSWYKLEKEKILRFKKNTATVEEIVDCLKSFPKDYHCYIENVDSIYPITGFEDTHLGEDEYSFSSVETNGKKVKLLTVSELLDLMTQKTGCAAKTIYNRPVYAEKAENLDESLDLQLDSPRAISAASVDSICNIVLFRTGAEYEYCA